jgi:hypothetical protein
MVRNVQQATVPKDWQLLRLTLDNQPFKWCIHLTTVPHGQIIRIVFDGPKGSGVFSMGPIRSQARLISHFAPVFDQNGGMVPSNFNSVRVNT